MYTFCKKYGNKILLREHNLPEAVKITKHTWNLYYEDKNGKYQKHEGITLLKVLS